MNEVKSTNPCGGPQYQSKRDQMEVVVMCDSKTHSTSAINVFKNAFDVDPVKRQNYMTTFLERGSHRTLHESVCSYVSSKRNKHSQPKLQPLAIDQSQMNI